MKKFVNTIPVILGIMLFLQSCLKDEFEHLSAETEELNNYKDFLFNTVDEYTVSILFLGAASQPLQGVVATTYSSSPFNEDGIKMPGSAENQIFKGISNSEGILSFTTKLSTITDSIYVHTQHIGFPQLTVIAANRANISVTIGGSSKQNKTDSNKKSAVLKNAYSAPVVVNGYNTLGSWDSQGTPNYLTEDDVITNDFLADVNASLPENIRLTESHPQYLANNNDANLFLIDSCNIWVTFVHEGAGWLNVLGYYTYPTGNPPAGKEDIVNSTIIFPNVSYSYSGGGLSSGNKVQLKYLNPQTNTYSETFPPGVTVGWFIIARGWQNKTVTGGSYTHYSDPQFNLEEDDNLKKHNVLLYDNEREILLLGFEDIRRDQGSDEDFNDAVFYASLNPVTAVQNSVYQPIDTPTDTDNDGVSDVFDEYSNDASKAFNNYYPFENGYGTLLFEDLWPYKGDYDFNDMVVDYRFNQVTNSNNDVTDIKANIVLRAIGASYKNAFGISLNVNPGAVQSVSGQVLTSNIFNTNSNGTEQNQSKAVIGIFDNCYEILPYPGVGVAVNTYPEYPKSLPETLTIDVAFTEPQSFAQVGTPPYNPFIVVNGNRNVEVHLPNLAPTDLVNTELFGTGHDDSNIDLNQYYVSDVYLPWAINLPVSFDYPIEKEDITETYLMFNSWAISRGFNYMDWYTNKPGYRNNSKIYLGFD